MPLQEKEQHLLNLLKINSRMSAAELGRQLGLARSTIHMMLARLEEKIIDSYTVKLKNTDVENQTSCYVLITRDPKKAADIEEKMRAMAAIDSLTTVAGQHDFIALVRTDNTQHMDRILTEIALMDGIIKTESHIILSEKFDRRL